jgi:hypothetical protein
MRELNLTPLRGALTQDRPATTERIRVRPPKLALLPKAPPPGGGLFLSAIIHAAAVFGLLAGLPYLFPGRRVIVVNIPEDWLRDPNHEVLYMPKLPRIERAGSPSDVKGEPSKKALTLAKLGADSSQAASARPKPLIAGPQVIVSDLPDSTNDVQTIRRPDLVNPPKFPKPVLIPSMVMLPAHARKVAVTPPIDQPVQPVMPNPQDLATFRASVPRVQAPLSPMTAPKAAVIPQVDPMQPVVSNPQELVNFRASQQPHVQVPVLPMGVPRKSSAVPAEAAVPRIANAADRGLPEFASNGPSAPQAVVVINAFGVPSQASPAIPNAELSGSFVVGPSNDAGGAHGGSAVAGGSVAGAGTGAGTAAGTGSGAGTGLGAGAGTGTSSNGGGNSSSASAGSASGMSGNGVGPNGSKDGTARTGSITITGGGRPGGGGGAGTAAGSGNGSMPGISIAGGTVGRSGAAAVTTGAISRRPYAITTISGGTSGGASRDLGVFSREETVYTVYIIMSDAGGGPDWPIEYALADSTLAGNGLLTPPLAIKKFQASVPKADLSANSGPVFVTGIIDDNGKLQGLRAIRVFGARAESALKALAKWEFLPAQLDGKSVASRVLIGVSVVPTEEAAKRQ